jgi:hypothetical protein
MRTSHNLQFLFAHLEIQHMWSVKESSKYFAEILDSFYYWCSYTKTDDLTTV